MCTAQHDVRLNMHSRHMMSLCSRSARKTLLSWFLKAHGLIFNLLLYNLNVWVTSICISFLLSCLEIFKAVSALRSFLNLFMILLLLMHHELLFLLLRRIIILQLLIHTQKWQFFCRCIIPLLASSSDVVAFLDSLTLELIKSSSSYLWTIITYLADMFVSIGDVLRITIIRLLSCLLLLRRG